MSDELETLVAKVIEEKDAAEAARIFNEEAIDSMHPDRLAELLEVVLEGGGDEESGTVYVNAIRHLGAEAQRRLNKALAESAEMDKFVEVLGDVASEPHRGAIVDLFIESAPDRDTTMQLIRGAHEVLSDELITKLGRHIQDDDIDFDTLAAAIKYAGRHLSDEQLLPIARRLQGDEDPDMEDEGNAIAAFGESLSDAGLVAFMRNLLA